MKKNNLDEMQEQKLLKIEHRGYRIAFWGIAAAIYVQIAIGHDDFMYIGGESIVLLLMSFYGLVDCIRNGIWDRKLQPTLKTNLCVSLVSGLLIGGFWFGVSYHNYHALAGSLATFAIMFLSVSGLVLAALTVTAAIYKRKKRQLEQQADTEENEE